MKACIAIDRWKLPIFAQQLTDAGYQFEKGNGFTDSTWHLYVVTDNTLALQKVVEEANNIAAATHSKKH